MKRHIFSYMSLHAPYPRFVPTDTELLFIHWLQFKSLHNGLNLKKTSSFCEKCYLLKDCLDLGVMKQLNCILETWEKKLRGSDASSILLGYMTEEEARSIYQNIRFLDHNDSHYTKIGKKRIEEMVNIYFNSICHQDLLEISPDTGNYLPFIIQCVVQFRTLSVRYNEIIMNTKENHYYMVVFVMTCLHLNGILAFSPAIVKFMWAEVFPESVLAWFYNKNI